MLSFIVGFVIVLGCIGAYAGVGWLVAYVAGRWLLNMDKTDKLFTIIFFPFILGSFMVVCWGVGEIILNPLEF